MAGAAAPARGPRRGAGDISWTLPQEPGAGPVLRYCRSPEGCPGPAGREDGSLAVADQEPDPDTYLRRFLEELLSLEPGLRQHVSDLVTGDLKEEISRDDTEFAAACRNAILMVEERWRNDE